MNGKQLKIQPIIIILACTLLLAAIVFHQLASKQETWGSIQQLEPAASRYEQLSGGYPTYRLWDEADHFLGYAVEGNASGYGGPLTILALVQEDGTLRNVIITQHCETPAYLARVLKANYLAGFVGKNVADPLEPRHGLDAISGATYTVEGIAQAVQKGASSVGRNVLGIQVHSPSKTQLGWSELGLVLFYGLAFIGITRNYTKLRPWVLGASVVFLGFLLNSALSLANLTSLISGNLPSVFDRPFWYLLTPGVFFFTLLWGKNFYCSWLCPFGGIQEGLYKVLGFMKFNVSPPIATLARKIRWGLIWLAMMAALVFNNPSLASYEPFAVSFGGSGNLGQWLTLFLVLLSSIIIYRVWCRFVCPVGAVLQFIAALKRKIRLLFSTDSPLAQYSAPDSDLLPTSAYECHSDCPECVATQQNTSWRDWGSRDKIFLVIMLVFIILTALTLFFNIPM